MADTSLSNAQRSDAVEAFLLEEAWGKTMAPWFTEACREAKKAWATARYVHGRDSPEAREAARKFRSACQQGRQDYARELPDLLKYSPKKFWGMFKK